jgi:hypothetical protein
MKARMIRHKGGVLCAQLLGHRVDDFLVVRPARQEK